MLGLSCSHGAIRALGGGRGPHRDHRLGRLRYKGQMPGPCGPWKERLIGESLRQVRAGVDSRTPWAMGEESVCSYPGPALPWAPLTAR